MVERRKHRVEVVEQEELKSEELSREINKKITEVEESPEDQWVLKDIRYSQHGFMNDQMPAPNQTAILIFERQQ